MIKLILSIIVITIAICSQALINNGVFWPIYIAVPILVLILLFVAI